MTTKTIIITITASAMLAACSAQPSPDKGEASTGGDGTEGAVPDTGEPISILRPEIAPPEQEPVILSPLQIVIGFPEGGSELDDSAIASLGEVLTSEQIATSAKITLRGHSDAGGNGPANERASQDRAEAVRDWLVEQGLDADRISIIAFGAQNPVMPNALPNGEPNEAGRAANRRVELRIIPPKGTVQKVSEPAGEADASVQAGD